MPKRIRAKLLYLVSLSAKTLALIQTSPNRTYTPVLIPTSAATASSRHAFKIVTTANFLYCRVAIGYGSSGSMDPDNRVFAISFFFVN